MPRKNPHVIYRSRGSLSNVLQKHAQWPAQPPHRFAGEAPTFEQDPEIAFVLPPNPCSSPIKSWPHSTIAGDGTVAPNSSRCSAGLSSSNRSTGPKVCRNGNRKHRRNYFGTQVMNLRHYHCLEPKFYPLSAGSMTGHLLEHEEGHNQYQQPRHLKPLLQKDQSPLPAAA